MRSRAGLPTAQLRRGRGSRRDTGGPASVALVLSVLTVAGLLLGTLLPFVAGAAAPAAAGPSATAPVTQIASGLANRTAPLGGELAGRLSFEVTGVDPVLVTQGTPRLTVTGTMTNTGSADLANLIYRFQRGPAFGSSDELRAGLAEPDQQTDAFAPDFRPLAEQLEPGATAPFTATTTLVGPDGLALSRPGVYPVMLNVNGDVSTSDGVLAARVGELHLVLTVVGVPSAAPPAPGTPVIGPINAEPLQVNIAWPLVDRPHLGVGGVFLDDDLAGSIAAGGRLTTLVDGLMAANYATPPDESITLVIDPELLDELDRMSRGYLVLADPQAPQPSPLTGVGARPAGGTPAPTEGTAAPPETPAGQQGPGAPTGTATPTGSGPSEATAPPAAEAALITAETPGVVAGSGQQSATVFLQRLRTLIPRYPTILLPAGDPDVVALTRAGMTEQIATAVQRGTGIAQRVLGPETADGLLTTITYPVGGLIDGKTLGEMSRMGFDGALLSATSVEPSRLAGAARVAVEADDGTAHAVPSVISQTGGLSNVAALVDQDASAGWALRVNALTGLLYQQVLDGTGQPAVVLPDRRWAPDSETLNRLDALLATLGQNQVITGVEVTSLLAEPGTSAATAYPRSAEASELPQPYLQRIGVARKRDQQIRGELAVVPQPNDPAQLLGALDDALNTGGSSAFRTDPAVGDANLTTVESTLTQIRRGVTIAAPGGSLTLASSSSPLVLTLQSSIPYDVQVSVVVRGGEWVGLTVTDPGPQVVPAGRSLQVRVPAEVSRSGQFQVGATLVGTDGSIWGTPVQLSVRSSAFGTVTVVIMIAAGAVLLVMVIWRIRQRLQARRARLAGPEPQPPPGDPLLVQPRSDSR